MKQILFSFTVPDWVKFVAIEGPIRILPNQFASLCVYEAKPTYNTDILSWIPPIDTQELVIAKIPVSEGYDYAESLTEL